MSAELMKSKFVRHPSSVRPSMASIISEVIAWISNFMFGIFEILKIEILTNFIRLR